MHDNSHGFNTTVVSRDLIPCEIAQVRRSENQQQRPDDECSNALCASCVLVLLVHHACAGLGVCQAWSCFCSMARQWTTGSSGHRLGIIISLIFISSSPSLTHSHPLPMPFNACTGHTRTPRRAPGHKWRHGRASHSTSGSCGSSGIRPNPAHKSKSKTPPVRGNWY